MLLSVPPKKNRYINGYLDSIDRETRDYFEAHGFVARASSEIYADRLMLWTFHLPAAP